MNSVLLEVYGNMTRIEKEVLRAFYSAKGPNNSIAVSIIEFMDNNSDASDDDIVQAIYHEKGSHLSKYSRVKRRVLNDMLTILARSIDVRAYSSPLAFRRSEVREILRNVDVLLLKGLEEMAIKELKRAERIGSKFELFNELSVIYDHLLQLVGFRTSEQDYTQLYTQLDAASHESWSVVRAKDTFMRITRPGYFAKTINSDVNRLLNQLQELANGSKSAIVRGYLYRAQSFIAFQDSKKEDALRYGRMYHDLVRNQPALNSNDNLGGAYMMQGLVYNSMGDHQSAYESAQNASKLFSSKSTNRFRALDLAFVSAINRRNVEEAEVTLEELKKYRRRKASGKLVETILYKELFFSVLFGRYNDANSIIIGGDYGKLGKSSYSIGFKVMELFILLFTSDVDQIEYRVINVKRSERDYLRAGYFDREKLLIDHLQTSIKKAQRNRAGLDRTLLIESLIQVLETKGSRFPRREHEITDYTLVLKSHLEREAGNSVFKAG